MDQANDVFTLYIEEERTATDKERSYMKFQGIFMTLKAMPRSNSDHQGYVERIKAPTIETRNKEMEEDVKRVIEKQKMKFRTNMLEKG